MGRCVRELPLVRCAVRQGRSLGRVPHRLAGFERADNDAVHLPLHRVTPLLRKGDLFLVDSLFSYGELLSRRLIPPLYFWGAQKKARDN